MREWERLKEFRFVDVENQGLILHVSKIKFFGCEHLWTMWFLLQKTTTKTKTKTMTIASDGLSKRSFPVSSLCVFISENWPEVKESPRLFSFSSWKRRWYFDKRFFHKHKHTHTKYYNDNTRNGVWYKCFKTVIICTHKRVVQYTFSRWAHESIWWWRREKKPRNRLKCHLKKSNK